MLSTPDILQLFNQREKMLSISDILQLFNQLEETAHAPNNTPATGPGLLSQKYLNYIKKKQQNPDTTQADYFKYMFVSLKTNPDFKSQIAIIDLISDDLIKDREKQHCDLLKNEDINLIEEVEAMRARYNSQMPTSLVPSSSLKTGGRKVKLPPINTSKDIAGALFKDDIEIIKYTLLYIHNQINIQNFIAPFCEENHRGFRRLYEFIATPPLGDRELKRFAIRVLVKFQSYFAENNIYIHDRNVARALFDTLNSEGPEFDEQIMQALVLCSSDCFTNNDISDLECMLLQENISFSQRYYVLLCLVIQSREKNKRYFPQESYTSLLIWTIGHPDAYYSPNATNQLFLLNLFLTTLKELTFTETPFKMIAKDAFLFLLAFCRNNLRNSEIPTFVDIISAMYVYNNDSNIFFESGTVIFLLSYLELKKCDNKNFINIINFLGGIAQTDPETLELCTQNKLYHKILAFWVQNNHNITDEDQQRLLFDSMHKFFYLDHLRTTCSNEHTVYLMLKHLNRMPQLAVKEHIISYLTEALKQNIPTIQTRTRYVFRFLGYWINYEQIENQIRILDLIFIYLKSEGDVLAFIKYDAYYTIKTLIENENLVLVRAVTTALFKLTTCSPKLARYLLSDTSLLYKIGDLANYSPDSDTRHYAAGILASLNKVNEDSFETKHVVPGFFGLKNRQNNAIELDQKRHFPTYTP